MKRFSSDTFLLSISHILCVDFMSWQNERDNIVNSWLNDSSPESKNSGAKRFCVDCGKEINPAYERCFDCNQKLKRRGKKPKNIKNVVYLPRNLIFKK